MTNPTADAIAALTQADVVVEGFLTDDPALVAAAARALLRQLREVRSALLSAQGQAGKPVATAEDARMAEFRGKIADAIDAYAEGGADRFNLGTFGSDFFESIRFAPDELRAVAASVRQPQPVAGATAALTTARTALEAAEELLARAGFGASDAYAEVAAALATIKGLET